MSKQAKVLHNLYKSDGNEITVDEGLYVFRFLITVRNDKSFHFILQVFLINHMVYTMDGCLNTDVSEKEIDEVIGPTIKKFTKKHKL